MKYKMFVVGNLYSEFEADNVKEAKKKVRSLCFKNVDLYFSTRGVFLTDEIGNKIAGYKPYFDEWYNW